MEKLLKLARVGKMVIKPSKVTKEMDADRELTKFINYCNEVKAATVACKEGGQLSILKPRKESVRSTDSVGSQEVNQVSIVRPSTGSAGNTNTT
ncbi:hypothetical protein Dimus_004388 [Dionaea muscipula]